jgi:hypothetical protein
MDNQDYFKLLSTNTEDLIDPLYYKKVNRKVITDTKEYTNSLINANNALIRYISTYQTLVYELGKSTDDAEILSLIDKMIDVLKVNGMNYSPFSQYLNVHNINYSIFSKLDYNKKVSVIKFILDHYIKQRHNMYLSHGYSNIVLQCLSDSYSHKRKGNYGTDKILDIISINEIVHYSKLTQKHKNIFADKYYIFPDKDGVDKDLFNDIRRAYNISFQYLDDKHKYPDALIKIGEHIFIVEQKNMKEDGGGQDKQTVEITDFIKYTEENQNFHYVTFVDGIYANKLIPDSTSKTLQQYTDIVTTLAKNKSNYFINSFGFSELIGEYCHKYECEKALKAIQD